MVDGCRVLDDRYTFDSFVMEESNQLARAAAVAVADAPGRTYNPLLIWGDSGSGKTHLLHAVGNYAKRQAPDIRVCYTTAVDFIGQRGGEDGDLTLASRLRYGEADLLLVDDVQVLGGMFEVQEAFVWVFDVLYHASRSIVVSSDRPVSRLTAMSERLRGRLGWGLDAGLGRPGVELRTAVLRQKAKRDRLAVPPEVLDFIAARMQGNLRVLEGALTRVAALSSLGQLPPTIEFAEAVLDLAAEGAPVS